MNVKKGSQMVAFLVYPFILIQITYISLNKPNHEKT